MTPQICLFISVALLIATVILACKKQFFWAVLCLIAADVFIVIPWSSTTGLFGESWGELSIPQRVVYMIGLESWTDPENGKAIASALGVLAPYYSSVFTLLCIATPVVAGVTAYSAITQKLSAWWIHFRILLHNQLRRADSGLYIFQGINPRSLAFIRSLYSPDGTTEPSGSTRSHALCIIADANKDSREKFSGDIESIKRWPVLLTEHSSYELCSEIVHHLKNLREVHLCFFSENPETHGDPESENVSDAVQIIELFAQHIPEDEDTEGGFTRFTEEGKPRYHFEIACRGRSDELVFDSIEKRRGFDIHVVDEGREVVYDLLWRHPLYKAVHTQSKRLVVVIFGWGHYGFEAFRACAWSGQMHGVRLHIHMVDKRPKEEFTEYAKHVCPGFFASIDGDAGPDSQKTANEIPGDKLSDTSSPPKGSLFDYTYHEVNARSSSLDECIKLIRNSCIINHKDKAQITPYCIVTLGDDDTNTDAAIDIKRLFCGDGASPIIEPQIYVDIYDERRHRTLKKLTPPNSSAFKLNPFGGIGRIFTKEYILNSEVEALALNVNASYCGSLRKDVTCSIGERKKNYLSYSDWQIFRLSNATNAMAIKQKLWDLGFELLPDNPLHDDAHQKALHRLQSKLDTEMDSYSSLIEKMARAEHDRWMTFYLAEGWQHVSAESSNVFKELGLNDPDKKRHDSHLLMLHPYICDFDKLKETADALGKSDPTPYDIHFIGDLARIVGDSRGLSGRSFTVIETDKTAGHQVTNP